jgi:hypothetical protein
MACHLKIMMTWNFSFFLAENMIYKGLDEDEAGFLTLVAQKQAEVEAGIKRRETEEVSDYRVSSELQG